MEAHNYIDGKWIASNRTLACASPNDGRIIGYSSLASKAEVSKAVAAAKVASVKWAATPIADRAACVARAADILRNDSGHLGQTTGLKELMRLEMGKRLPEAAIEIDESSTILRFFAEQGPLCLRDQPLELNRALWPSKKSSICFQPLGVVASIKPWNYPLEIPLWSIGAALVAGNTVVFKPSEICPFTGTKIIDLFERAGLPRGVLNMVTGNGNTGVTLVEHPDLSMVSFTGSKSVGRAIAQRCAKRLVPYNLELGGKDAMVVLPDADLELAVSGALWGSFTNCGQVCVGVRRLLIAKEIKKQFVDRFLSAVASLRLGTDIAPLASTKQLRRVQRHVQDAVRLGAEILCGGTRPRDESLEAGNYYYPTVLTRTTSEMLVERDDTFGPVVYIKQFSSDEEAVKLANNADYDLGASVWTNDYERGMRIAKQLKVGMVWLNDVNIAYPEAPWGGLQRSGHGIELSKFSFWRNSSIKHINCDTGNAKRRPWWFPYSD